MTRTATIVVGVAGTLMLVGAWQASATHQVAPMLLPSPAATWNALQRGLVNGDLLPQSIRTVARVLQGWTAASLIAIMLGTAIGISASARAYLLPMLTALRAVPAPAVIPLAVALFGLDFQMALAVIVFGAMWPTLFATVIGVGEVEPRLIEVAMLLQLSRPAFVTKVSLPTAARRIVAGMRRSFAIALALTVTCEMVAGATGLGSEIMLAARTAAPADLFAGIALLGLVGLVGNHVLTRVERRALAR